MKNKLGQFLKGCLPWNKSKKGIHLSPDTEFKKGENHTGEKHPSWKGGKQIMNNDCVHVWTNTGKRVRRPRAIWESVHGPIPKNHVIVHRDGDKHHDNISNLECISRAEHKQRNAKKNKK